MLVDLVDDATVSGAQPRLVARSDDELDPRPDRNPGADPSREKPCTLSVHTRGIGFDGPRLYPLASHEGDAGRTRVRIGEVASSRRIAPNSTA